jgi:ATP-dependent DNA ligase
MIDSQTIKFAKAKGGYVDQVPESLFEDPTYVMEKKYDGCRYRMVIEEGGVILQSRRISKKTGKFVEKQDRVPHITTEPCFKHYAGTVFEGEIVISPDACTSSEVVSIMGSDPEKAIARQAANGWLHWVLFDVLFIEGIDVRGLPESVRREKLDDILFDLRRGNPSVAKYWHLSDRYEIGEGILNHMETYLYLINEGCEGGMLKDTRAPYGKGWYKVKQVTEVDVFISGWTEGQGKFEGQVGAIEFSVLDTEDKPRYLGRCSGFDDVTRAGLTAYRGKLLNTPFEVLCQEVCRKKEWYSLRHPRFSRWREDLNRSDCTAEKLEREIK